MKKEQIKECLARMDKLGTGEFARLRRNASKPYEKADFRAIGIVLRLLPPEVKPWEEAPMFSALSLRSLWREPKESELTFAKAVAMLQKRREEGESRPKDGESEKKNMPTLEKRFLSLLDEPLSAEGLFQVKLYRLGHMMASQGLQIDWVQLASDFLKWNHPERYVQTSWAKDFYHVPKFEEPTNDEEE